MHGQVQVPNHEQYRIVNKESMSKLGQQVNTVVSVMPEADGAFQKGIICYQL